MKPQNFLLTFGLTTILTVSGVNIFSPSQKLSFINTAIAQNSSSNCGRNIELRPTSKNLTYPRGTSWRTCNGYVFIFQNDGNLVLYNPSGTAIWATHTQSQAPDTLAIQTDGNMVLYKNNGSVPVWAVNPGVRSGSFLAIQTDGNVVLYDRSGAYWATRTAGTAGSPTDSLKPLTGTRDAGEKTARMQGGFARSSARFNRDGSFVITAYTESQSYTEGVRGAQTFLIARDANGRAIFISKPFGHTTACSKPDPCASRRTENFVGNVPPALAPYVDNIEIYVGHNGEVGGIRDSIRRTISQSCGVYRDLPAPAQAFISMETGGTPEYLCR